MSELDVYESLALCAFKGGWVKPTINDSLEISYTRGRHPLVEATLDAGEFVPNDLTIGTPENQIMLITGPNMGGDRKSVV